MAEEISEKRKAEMGRIYENLPLSFIYNQGQTDEEVAYEVRTGNSQIFLTTANEIVFNRAREIEGQIVSDVVTSFLVEANPAPIITGVNQLEGIANFLTGNEPSEWVRSVPTFAGVLYEDVYPGIDRLFTGSGDNLKSDFVLAPGADPNSIRIDYEHVKGVRIRKKDGALVVRTPYGRWVETAPVAYQDIEGERLPVEASYILLDERGNPIRFPRLGSRDAVVGFQLGEYDPNYPLVIDPELEYSTYLGGSDVVETTIEAFIDLDTVTVTEEVPVINETTGEITIVEIETQEQEEVPNGSFIDTLQVTNTPGTDAGYAITVDSTGSTYITGETSAANFPNPTGFPGPFPDPEVGLDIRDAFITKIDADGVLVYSTYIGGEDRDRANGIAVDSAGSAYIVGETESTNFPVISRIDAPFQPFAGGSQDAFVAKLNPTGTQFDYASYLGGVGRQRGIGIFVNSNEFAYVTGQTNSANLATTGAFQTEFQGGSDAFIAKVNPEGSSLEYLTYIGGNGFDEGIGIAEDDNGEVYISGTTESSGLATAGAFQTDLLGRSDAFITKLNADGSEQVYFTYIGGGGGEVSGGIALDSNGSAYITGITPSPDFPTKRAFQESYQGGPFDAFITKLNSEGSDLDYSTFIGGSGNEGINFLPQTAANIAVDRTGSAYIIGTTNSTETSANPFPISPGSQQENFGGGLTDIFITKLNPEGSDRIYSSFFGGSGADRGYGITLDETGAAYITGQTLSEDFPTFLPPDFPGDPEDDIQLVDPSPEQGPILVQDNPTAGSLIPEIDMTDPNVEGVVPVPGEVNETGVFKIPNREDAFVSKFAFEGVVITEFGGSVEISEEGATDIYSLELAIQPTDSVTIDITPDDQSTVSPTSVIFTRADWDIPQRIEVTAVDDAVLEGSHDSTITHSISSADPNYSIIPVGEVIANIPDNEFGIIVQTSEADESDQVTALITSEEGATAEFTVVLGNVPSANVIIPISSLDPGEGLVSSGVNTENPEEPIEPSEMIELVFSPDNWDIPQAVTVTGVDDGIDNGDVDYTIAIGPAVSDDGNYNDQEVESLQVTNMDLNSPPPDVILTETEGGTDVTEGGATDAYEVALNSPPTDNVQIAITIPDEQTITAPEILTFTPDNWNSQMVMVGAVNDQVLEGPQESIIIHTARSSDPDYNEIDINAIAVNITDNPGVRINQSQDSTTITEGGGTDAYSLTLTRQPEADVTIAIESDNQSIASPGSLTFTPDNWNIPQTVVVAAVRDQVVEGNHTSRITHTLTSADRSFSGIAVATVTANISENNAIASAGISITESDGSTEITEGGATDTYMVVLDALPSADVEIAIASDNQSEIAANIGSPNQPSRETILTFTPTNWDVPQAVMVSAVDDLAVESTHSSTITHGVSSIDSNYNSLPVDNLTVTITDNDVMPDEQFSLDIDDNGITEAFTDGFLLLRYQFGFRGNVLINGAIGSGARRQSAAEIEAYLDGADSQLDLDGNGSIEALKDGIMALRYLFGFRGNALVNGLLGSDGTRDGNEIEALLQSYDI